MLCPASIWASEAHSELQNVHPCPGHGTGKRGHCKMGLFTGGISRISKISGFSRISRKRPDSPLFSTVWEFSRISRKWTFLKRPLFQKIPFSKPELFGEASRGGLPFYNWHCVPDCLKVLYARWRALLYANCPWVPKCEDVGFSNFKVPEGHHPRGTTLREALRGNLPLRGLCGGGLSEGPAGSLRGFCGVSAGFCGGPRDFPRFSGVVTLCL